MKTVTALLLASALACASAASSQEMHSHPAPEKLGRVSFPTSCAPAVAHDFERAVALLHSFAYTASEQAFRGVADADPSCAMAHWGIAMSHFHPLWSPPAPDELAKGEAEATQATRLGAKTARERSSGVSRSAPPIAAHAPNTNSNCQASGLKNHSPFGQVVKLNPET